MRHTVVLIGLLLIASVVQIVAVQRSVVPALDAVRFVETAQSMDQHGVLATVVDLDEQPLFPTWVWLVHKCFGHSLTWAGVVQLAAAVPLVLAVVPVYFLTLRFLGASAAWAGTLIFCLLPEVSRLGADGISDSTHLLFFALAGLAVVECIARKNVWFLLPAGLATGFALLARAEVIILPAALMISLILFQLRPEWRQSWSKLGLGVCCYAFGFALVFAPYLIAIDSAAVVETASAPLPDHAWQLADGEQMSFEVKDPNRSSRHRGWTASIGRFAEELADVFNYGVGVLVLFGLWQLRHTPLRPIDRFVHVFFLLFSMAVIWFTAREGYLHARHLLPLVVFGIGCGGYGAIELGRRVLRSDRLAWTAVGFVVFVCLMQTVQPLHAKRCGHRAAAEWLATGESQPGMVLDTRGWTGLYSNRETVRYDRAKQAFYNWRLAYVVLERRELSFDSSRSRTLRHLLQTSGSPARVFPGPSGEESDPRSVVVYRWQPQRFGQQIAVKMER